MFQTRPSPLLTFRMCNADVAGRPGNEAINLLCSSETDRGIGCGSARIRVCQQLLKALSTTCSEWLFDVVEQELAKSVSIQE